MVALADDHKAVLVGEQRLTKLHLAVFEPVMEVAVVDEIRQDVFVSTCVKLQGLVTLIVSELGAARPHVGNAKRASIVLVEVVPDILDHDVLVLVQQVHVACGDDQDVPDDKQADLHLLTRRGAVVVSSSSS